MVMLYNVTHLITVNAEQNSGLKWNFYKLIGVVTAIFKRETLLALSLLATYDDRSNWKQFNTDRKKK